MLVVEDVAAVIVELPGSVVAAVLDIAAWSSAAVAVGWEILTLAAVAVVVELEFSGRG